MTEEIKFSGTYFYANGKRKTAVARVRLYKGTGRVVVNGKEAKDYFPTKDMLNVFMAPLVSTKNEKNFDISAKIIGGGSESQAEALRHGISKALVVAESSNRSTLKPTGYLTRDSRVKERKKFGLKRARRAPQFSKR
ncbi:30S ribosomal protein S9 [Patescibacteria group bacterium]|nr:30S ribosomal protein S9 [Patescibacteria group bacterium]